MEHATRAIGGGWPTPQLMGILDSIGIGKKSATASPSRRSAAAPKGAAATTSSRPRPGASPAASGKAAPGKAAPGKRPPGKKGGKGSAPSARDRVQSAAAPLHDRRRRLVSARETTLRDLGGLMLEMYKRNRFREELLLDKCEEILAIEVEIAHVDQRLFQLAPPNAAGMRPIGRCDCGAPIHPGQNFCGVCGRSFSTLTHSRSCVRCGAGLRPGDQFCATCGEEAPDVLQALEPGTSPSSPDGSKVDAAALAASAVADTLIIDVPSIDAADVPPLTPDPAPLATTAAAPSPPLEAPEAPEAATPALAADPIPAPEPVALDPVVAEPAVTEPVAAEPVALADPAPAPAAAEAVAAVDAVIDEAPAPLATPEQHPSGGFDWNAPADVAESSNEPVQPAAVATPEVEPQQPAPADPFSFAAPSSEAATETPPVDAVDAIDAPAFPEPAAASFVDTTTLGSAPTDAPAEPTADAEPAATDPSPAPVAEPKKRFGRRAKQAVTEQQQAPKASKRGAGNAAAAPASGPSPAAKAKAKEAAKQLAAEKKRAAAEEKARAKLAKARAKEKARAAREARKRGGK